MGQFRLPKSTGLRIGKEAFPLKWEDVDLVNGVIPIRKSKTPAGERGMPLSEFCQAELLRWRQLLGPEFSPYVFPNLKNPSKHVKSLKRAWRSALRKAKISFFPIYNLRATFASRLNATGASDLFVAQMLGHSSTAILGTYAKVIDEYRRDAIRKLEAFRQTSTLRSQEVPIEEPEPKHATKLQ